MSGPVWRVVEGETVACSQCLKETDRALVEGTVSEGEFLPDRSLCNDCYRESIHLIARSA